MKLNSRVREELKKHLKAQIARQKEQYEIISATKLSRDDWGELFRAVPELKGADVIEKIDPSIMAGVLVRQGSRVYDLSLSGMIKNLKVTLS